MSVKGDSKVSEVCCEREEWSKWSGRKKSGAVLGAPLARARKVASVAIEADRVFDSQTEAFVTLEALQQAQRVGGEIDVCDFAM